MLCTKISSITYNYQNLRNLKKSEKSKEPSGTEVLENVGFCNIPFQKCKLKLVKPELKTPFMEKMSDKIVNYMKNLPENSRMPKPVLFNFENKMVEFSMNKLQQGLAEVNMNILDGNTGLKSGMKIFLNKKGQMVKGCCYNNDYVSVEFERNNRNVRRISYGNAFYMPFAKDNNIWERMVINENDHTYYTAAQHMDFCENELQTFFMQLAKKNTALLAE